jgi:RNA polymerase sigma-70 factor (ECF subfamily)
MLSLGPALPARVSKHDRDPRHATSTRNGRGDIQAGMADGVGKIPPVGRDADDEVIRRMGQGDAGALRRLYERHGGRAMAIALRILQQRHDAEDVVQETFLEIWKRAASFDPGRGEAAAWISTIARTRAIDRLRLRGSAARAVAASFQPMAPVHTPVEAVEQREARRIVEAALGALPAEQRTVIELAYFQGLSQTEIAERTGEALGTVKTRVRLAMEKLSGLVGGDSIPGGAR